MILAGVGCLPIPMKGSYPKLKNHQDPINVFRSYLGSTTCFVSSLVVPALYLPQFKEGKGQCCHIVNKVHSFMNNLISFEHYHELQYLTSYELLAYWSYSSKFLFSTTVGV